MKLQLTAQPLAIFRSAGAGSRVGVSRFRGIRYAAR